MKYESTVASQCRYGEVAARIFGDADIIHERSEADWQGYAEVFAQLSDGQFCHYEWGSCLGCDDWEARGLEAGEIEAEMRAEAVYFTDADVFAKYLEKLSNAEPLTAFTKWRKTID